MMGFGLLIPVILVGIIAYAFGWRPQGSFSQPFQPQNRSALDVAKERYARGEISREEFEILRDELTR